MLGTSRTPFSSAENNQMDYGSLITRNIVETFESTVSNDAFKNLIYQFLRILWSLRNPKISDYKKALDTFQQQHYHAFLYHCQVRSSHCHAFIKVLQDFDTITKKTKKHYKDLFTELESFQMKTGLVRLPGGTCEGIPFVFTDKSVTKWYHDQVTETRKRMGLPLGKLVGLHYPEFENGRWTGHTWCPANSKTNHKMTKTEATYLVYVGYETTETVQQKWGFVELDVPEQAQGEDPKLYALVHQNAEEVSSLFEELDLKHWETLEDCLRLHLHSPDKLRDRVFQNIVQRYDDSIRQLAAERDTWQSRYQQAHAGLTEHEMLLSTAKRKVDDLYDDIDHLDTKHKRARASLDSAEREIQHLNASLHHKNTELRKSIDAQWQLYHQLHGRRN